MGAKLQTNISSGQLPELQIWRSMDGANYQKVGFNLLTSNSHRVNYLLNVYEYAPNPPLKFQKGDILGVYQPVDSEIELSYQINDAPINYELDYTDAANIVPLSMQYDYPLVTGNHNKCIVQFIEDFINELNKCFAIKKVQFS